MRKVCNASAERTGIGNAFIGTSKRWNYRFIVLVGLLCLTICPAALAQVPAQKKVAAPVAAPQPTELDVYVRDFQFIKLARSVAKMNPSTERDYFAGVLANRENRLDESIALLEKALAAVKKSNSLRAAVGLHALADDYVKSFRYNDAIAAYKDLLDNFAGQLDKAELQSTRDDYAAVQLLKDAPPQTVSFKGPIDLPIERNPVLGTMDVSLTVNGVTQAWLLDTGANFSAISASFAKKLGLQMANGKAQTEGITGDENNLQVGVLPELKVGGATLHNVVLLVLEDSSLNVPSGPKSRYQIEAILGYPVMQALQRITFTKDGHFLAGPESPAIDGGATLYMNLLMPLLQCRVDGQDVLFSFDTGANHSFFSIRYRREFESQLHGLKEAEYHFGGAGGIRSLQAYYLPQGHLGVGTTTATLTNVPILRELGTDTDKLFGNLGRDVTDPYKSFTIDFTKMRFALGEKAR
jgi:tetratricopeptide (TPR) repeat protein